jgi:hypothetical protein
VDSAPDSIPGRCLHGRVIPKVRRGKKWVTGDQFRNAAESDWRAAARTVSKGAGGTVSRLTELIAQAKAKDPQ